MNFFCQRFPWAPITLIGFPPVLLTCPLPPSRDILFRTTVPFKWPFRSFYTFCDRLLFFFYSYCYLFEPGVPPLPNMSGSDPARFVLLAFPHTQVLTTSPTPTRFPQDILAVYHFLGHPSFAGVAMANPFSFPHPGLQELATFASRVLSRAQFFRYLNSPIWRVYVLPYWYRIIFCPSQ